MPREARSDQPDLPRSDVFLHEQDGHQPGGGLEVMEKDDQIGGLELWNGVDQLQISRFGKTKGSKP